MENVEGLDWRNDMSTLATSLRQAGRKRQSIVTCVDCIEQYLDDAAGQIPNHEFCEYLSGSLGALHAAMRAHDAVDIIMGPDAAPKISPQYVDDMARLRSEHSTLLGVIDRLIRSSDAIPDQPLEDKDVYLMRLRELVAVIRRHQAEEDRLFYLSVWQDTGGES